MTFDSFKFSEPLLNAIKSKGYTETTPVQEEAIPLLLKGKDVLACAQTGTGKTIAFLLPLLQSLMEAPTGYGIKALILTPTRELAIQIGKEIDSMYSHTRINCAVIIGGDSFDAQTDQIERGVDILVATPGRMSHLQTNHSIDFRRLQWLIIDEGDLMLDMGFIGTIRKIAKGLPRKRHTALFTATLRTETIKLAKEILYRPATVNMIAEKHDLSLISQDAYYVDKPNKLNLLIHLLKEYQVKTALIFVRTRQDAEKLALSLTKAGFTASTLHGDKEQDERRKAYQNFAEGETDLLIATDLAARGIDIPDLEYVFNFDLPNEPETYIHRIGRTGRAGKSGKAISLCSNAELRFLKPIRKLVGKNTIQIIETHPFSYAPRKKEE
ncbi:MAG: DEAD/DEAH box helicase [Bacteroidales bacterium]